MKQGQLINTQSMSSAKTIARLARERVIYSFRLVRASAAKSPANIAKAPDSIPISLPESSPETLTVDARSTNVSRNSQSRTGPQIEDALEFNLPDEDRNIPVYMLPKCPGCGRMPIMVRTNYAKQWRIECDTKRFQLNPPCPEPDSPFFPASQQAVAHWKMVAALTKL